VNKEGVSAPKPETDEGAEDENVVMPFGRGPKPERTHVASEDEPALETPNEAAMM
jgi:hypothetical protein